MVNHSLRYRRRTRFAIAAIVVFTLAFATYVGEADSAPDQIIDCLAANVYHEARGESLSGQRAVADVTLNRVDSPQWPNTLCAVVWQTKQFSWTHDKLSDELLDEKARAVAYQIAWEALNTHRAYDATHYHATHTRPYWADSLRELYQIGNHIFYK